MATARCATAISMNKGLIALPLLFLSLYIPLDAAAGPPPFTQQEIDHLLGYVENSGCEFYRNGTWYDSQKAVAHLRTKYGFLRPSVNRAEDFIEKAASRSSLSGQPYQVRCGPGVPVPGAQWLGDELIRFRTTLSRS